MTKKTIQIKDLAASENYAVQIRATGLSEETQSSDWSLTLQFTTNTDLIAPDKVFGVSVVADGADFVASWSAVVLDANLDTLKDLKNYRVRFFQADDVANFKDFITDNLSQRITFSEVRAELSSVPNISVAVFARDTALNESVTSAVDSVTNGPPSGFTAPTASSESDGQAIKVVFNQPTGVAVNGSDNSDDLSYYEIYKSPDSGTDSLVETIAFQEGQVSFIDPDPGSDTWTYYVKAYDLYGSLVLSPESNPITPIYPFNDTTPPDPVSALGLAGFAVVNSVSGDEAYINVTFTATVTNDDVTHTDYLDNEGFSVHYRVNGSGDSFEFITIPDLRTGNPLAADTIAVRINGLKTEETYEVGVAAFDTSGNYSSYLSGTELTPVDSTAPGQPSAPVAAADVQSILVTHDLTLQAGGNLPDDTSALIVYASETSGFTSSSANYLGTITVVPNFADAVQKFPLPNSEANVDGADAPAWYVRVRAVDASGNESVESAQNAVTPTLVSGAYIDNATVNDAKINTLSANKLVADSAFVNRLSVESELEVNTDGFVKSSEWDGNDDGSGSTVGWWLGDDGLVINGGTIEAAALNIVEPNANLARFEFASFPNTTQFYDETLYLDNMVSVGASAVWSRYGGRSLNLTSTAGGAGTVYFSGDTTTTDYNVIVEPSTKYIMSCYVYHEFGYAVDIRIKVREDDNSETNPVSGTAASGVATRISYVFTTKATTNAVLPGLLVQGAAANVDFHVDGFQIEQVSGGVEEPSFFKSPGYTTIEGNSITTGQIQSSNFSTGTLGWEIDLDGNAEFNDVTARGAIYATSGEIGDLDITGTLTIEPTGLLKAVGTGAEAGRVEIDDSGIRMYDDTVAGEVTVNLDTDTGKALFTGAVTIVETESDERTNIALTADWTGSTSLVQAPTGTEWHIDEERTGTGGYSSVGDAPGTPGSSVEGVYFEMDFGSVKPISELRTYWYAPNARSYYYKVKYSRDGTNWFYAIGNSSNIGWAKSTKVSDTISGPEIPTVNLFNPRISARYIQIHGGGNNVNNGNHVYEIEAYTARTSRPALSVGQNFMVDEGGNLFADSGTFSGDIVGATTIKIGSGTSVFKADTQGIYLGNESFNSAPFRVSPQGYLTATSGTFSGDITGSAITGSSVRTEAFYNAVYGGSDVWFATEFSDEGVLEFETGPTANNTSLVGAIFATTPDSGADGAGLRLQTSSTIDRDTYNGSYGLPGSTIMLNHTKGLLLKHNTDGSLNTRIELHQNGQLDIFPDSYLKLEIQNPVNSAFGSGMTISDNGQLSLFAYGGKSLLYGQTGVDIWSSSNAAVDIYASGNLNLTADIIKLNSPVNLTTMVRDGSGNNVFYVSQTSGESRIYLGGENNDWIGYNPSSEVGRVVSGNSEVFSWSSGSLQMSKSIGMNQVSRAQIQVHSSSSGTNEDGQSAHVLIGESADSLTSTGSLATMHLGYQGNGYGILGMGGRATSTNYRPYWDHFEIDYDSTDVRLLRVRGGTNNSGRLPNISGWDTLRVRDSDGIFGYDGSSIRWKENVQDWDSWIGVLDFRPVIFDWKDEQAPCWDSVRTAPDGTVEGGSHVHTEDCNVEDIGLIAEEVMAIDPRLVKVDENGDPRSVRYEMLTVYLLAAVQALAEELGVTEAIKARGVRPVVVGAVGQPTRILGPP